LVYYGKTIIKASQIVMRRIKYIIQIAVLLNFSKYMAQQSSVKSVTNLDSLNIKINIILEDAATNHYVIDWNDSLGVYENNKLIDKAYELHCYISDSKGLIGSYHGLSTSFTFCNFHTKDSLIEVVFILAPNFNSKKGRDTKSGIDSTWLNTYVEYEKISISVKRIENLKLSLHKRSTESDIVVVKNNCTKNRVVVLSYWNKKNNTRIVKKGQLLRLHMNTGDRIQLKNSALSYTHVANGKTSIYLCSNTINR